MIKGDLRKKQILETAEEMFAERGYEQTSVQDILDRLQMSKGSFYHHFERKALVLRTICENRAEKAAEDISKEKSGTGLEQINHLLSEMIPFQGEGLTFLRMLLPVLALPEGQSVLAGYQAALKKAWEPQVREALNAMIGEETAFARYPEESVGIALDLVNDLWGRVSQEMLRREGPETDQSFLNRMLRLVSAYRAAVENLFSAPYGTIDLMNMETLASTEKALRKPD